MRDMVQCSICKEYHSYRDSNIDQYGNCKKHKEEDMAHYKTHSDIMLEKLAREQDESRPPSTHRFKTYGDIIKKSNDLERTVADMHLALMTIRGKNWAESVEKDERPSVQLLLKNVNDCKAEIEALYKTEV